MPEEARRILTMLSEGKISVDEAERLLAALRAPEDAGSEKEGGCEEDPKEAAGRERPPRRQTGPKPKYLRVVVSDEDRKVNVRAPTQLIRAAAKFGALIPEKARADIEKRLSQQGVELDLRKISPENIEALLDEMGDLTVEIEEGGKRKVRVFCE